MEKTKITELHEAGQSVWLDYISRPLIEQGKLKSLINLGLSGITSNPTIFDKAISSSSDYDIKIKELSESGKSTFEIYDELTVSDIQNAADILRPVYQASEGLDGYVSLEVNPQLAYDRENTIKEAKRLWHKVNRPNLMLKVPATTEGCLALEEIVALGFNVNATLIFSLKQYYDTALAYIKGLKRFLAAGGEAKNIRSVASVFVSRIDTVIDRLLEDLIASEKFSEKDKLKSLKGKAAVANSKLIYKKFLDISSSEEFKEISNKGANVQRLLWASTSTKNPDYKDIKYVVELIAKDTINTLPQATFEAFLDHGSVRGALSSDISEAETIVDSLASLDINLDKVCQELLKRGVFSFQESFKSLLGSIDAKIEKVCQS